MVTTIGGRTLLFRIPAGGRLGSSATEDRVNPPQERVSVFEKGISERCLTFFFLLLGYDN
jgi:hypothetical protein